MDTVERENFHRTVGNTVYQKPDDHTIFLNIEAFCFAEIESFPMNNHFTGKPALNDKSIDLDTITLINPLNVHDDSYR